MKDERTTDEQVVINAEEIQRLRNELKATEKALVEVIGIINCKLKSLHDVIK